MKVVKPTGDRIVKPKGYRKAKSRLRAQRHAIAHSGISSGDERLMWLRR